VAEQAARKFGKLAVDHREASSSANLIAKQWQNSQASGKMRKITVETGTRGPERIRRFFFLGF